MGCLENLARAVSLHYMHYNFARPHTTPTKANNGYPTTPAMAAGVADHVWTLTELSQTGPLPPDDSEPRPAPG